MKYNKQFPDKTFTPKCYFFNYTHMSVVCEQMGKFVNSITVFCKEENNMPLMGATS